MYLELLIRAEFNLSPESLKPNTDFCKSLIFFIQSDWPEPKGNRLLLHFFINIPKELISEEISSMKLFDNTLDSLLIDLNETYEFLKFESKHIDFLLKRPDFYSVLIKKITEILINLVKNPEISLDEKNFVVFQAKFAEFFNLSVFFLSFPLMIQMRRKFRIYNEKKRKEIFVFTQKYCLECGKKINEKQKILPIKRDFNTIICKECEFVINPYYFNEEIFEFDIEINGDLIKLCEEGIHGLKNEIKKKIKEEIEGILGKNKVYLEYFFKNSNLIFALIFSNIIRDFPI